MAIYSRDDDARAVATDALIEGLLDGRGHPEPLAEVLVQLCQIGFLKSNRLAATLQDVCRVSDWSALVISEVLQRVIASWKVIPRDAYHILGVQLAALMQIDGALSIESRRVLEGIKGSSKTAKLAKHLLALPGGRDSATWQSALVEGLEIRIRRAAGRLESSA